MNAANGTEALLAQQHAHREELARMHALLLRHRELLEHHGIEAPEDAAADGALQNYRACRRAAELSTAIRDYEEELRLVLRQIRSIT